MKIFTPKGIDKMKKGNHWFYGVVKLDGHVYVLAEIFPGTGYSPRSHFDSPEVLKMLTGDLAEQILGIKRRK